MAFGRCPACGSAVDGDVCDWRCAREMDERVKWEGKEPCQKCMETEKQQDWEPATHGDLCEQHEDERNEAAAERRNADFYGA